MKKFMLFVIVSLILVSIMAYAQPFGPPLYIADPVAMKCRYYFAGDQRHFNPRPDNYTINIAYTTDMKNEQQACDFFRCVYTNGSVKIDKDRKPLEKDLCLCHGNYHWDVQFGCIKTQNQDENLTFLQSFWRWAKRLFKFK